MIRKSLTVWFAEMNPGLRVQRWVGLSAVLTNAKFGGGSSFQKAAIGSQNGERTPWVGGLTYGELFCFWEMTGNPRQSEYSLLTWLVQLGVDQITPSFSSYFLVFEQGLRKEPWNPEPAESESILSWNEELSNVSKQHFLPCNCETYAIETKWYFPLFVKCMATETLQCP